MLLPAVERDAVLEVLRALLAGPVSWSRGLLAASVAPSIALALVVLWLVIVELTRFYFHANHVVHADGEVFTPRFTLTGVRMATDEFDADTNAAYEEVHAAERTVRLLVPGNVRARARIDRQLDAYPGLRNPELHDDRARAEALFELAAARRRTMVEEVAKIEYGIVRHMLRLQVIVLRYVEGVAGDRGHLAGGVRLRCSRQRAGAHHRGRRAVDRRFDAAVGAGGAHRRVVAGALAGVVAPHGRRAAHRRQPRRGAHPARGRHGARSPARRGCSRPPPPSHCSCATPSPPRARWHSPSWRSPRSASG